jgi:ABC-type lipoprotein export system ATPase subunit
MLRIKYYKNIYAINLSDNNLANIHNDNLVNIDKSQIEEIYQDFDIVEFIRLVDNIKENYTI